MKPENRRIFISDLPESISEADLRNKFQEYGNVSSVEVRKRKELTLKNTCHHFAYVNLNTDDQTLQRCFHDVSSRKWKGHYVPVELAKESFLEKLKREREEQKGGGEKQKDATEKHSVEEKHEVKEKYEAKEKQEVRNKNRKSKDIDNSLNKKMTHDDYHSSSESDSEEDLEVVSKNRSKVDSKDSSKIISKEDSEECLEIEPEKESGNDNADNSLVIKRSQSTISKDNKLVIKSEGFEPIIKIDKSKPKKVETESDKKRLQSLREMKKTYQLQKNLLKSSLSTVDKKTNNKIIFDEDGKSINEGSKKKQRSNEKSKGKISQERINLFNEESDPEEEEYNFEVRKQFEGEKGQKLLQLQSKTKKDKRFAMDERFLDDGEEENGEQVADEDNYTEEDLTVIQEKQKEMAILEKVLGRKISTSADPRSDKKKRGDQPNYLVRYDPTNPDHGQFEIKPTQVEANPKKRKRKNAEQEEGDKKRKEEEQPVEVSKEKFYKVTENLKEALQENQSFSLLSAFGRRNEEEDGEGNEDENRDGERNGVEILRSTRKELGRNPFRYDSSDDEDNKGEFNGKEGSRKEGSRKEGNRNEGNGNENTGNEGNGNENPGNEDNRNQVNGNEDNSNSYHKNLNTSSMGWNESFFFQKDDYRFQEGRDFVLKMLGRDKDKGEFLKLRGQLKKIIKAKVKNATKKDKLFKNKIGNTVGKKHKLHGKKPKFGGKKGAPKKRV